MLLRPLMRMGRPISSFLIGIRPRLLHGWGAYMTAFQKDRCIAPPNLTTRTTDPLLSPAELSLSSCFSSTKVDSFELSAVGVGHGHSLVSFYDHIQDTSLIAAFGLNRSCQLGVKSSTNPSFTNYTIKGRVNQISCGREHTVVLSSIISEKKSSLYTFGNNSHGQLGIYLSESPNVPANVLTLCENSFIQHVTGPYSNIKQIACGLDHSIILRKDGELFTFGWNADGQLGNGSDHSTAIPTCISSHFDSKVSAVSTSTDLNLALTQDNQLYTWGNGEYMNNMLNSPLDKIIVPTKVKFEHGKIASFAAGGAHSLVANTDGEVYICGYGTLGLGESELRLPSPAKVPNLKDIVSVYASTDYSVAKDTNGKFYIWGINNKSGILGIGHTKNQLEPTPLLLDSSVNTKNARLALGNLFSLLY